MTRRDQELFDRQLRGLHIQPRHDGTMILAMVRARYYWPASSSATCAPKPAKRRASTPIETAFSAASGSNPTLTALR